MGATAQWVHNQCEGIYTTKTDPKGRITIPLPIVRELCDRTYIAIRDCSEIVIDKQGILYQGRRICRINTTTLDARIKRNKGPFTDIAGKQSILDDGVIDYAILARDLIIKTYIVEKKNKVRVYGTLDARINKYLQNKDQGERYTTVEGYTIDDLHRLVLNKNNEIRKKAEQTSSREIIIIGKRNCYVIGAETEREFLRTIQFK